MSSQSQYDTGHGGQSSHGGHVGHAEPPPSRRNDAAEAEAETEGDAAAAFRSNLARSADVKDCDEARGGTRGWRWLFGGAAASAVPFTFPDSPIPKHLTSLVRLYQTPAAVETAAASLRIPEPSICAWVSCAPFPLCFRQSTEALITPSVAVKLTSRTLPLTLMPKSSFRPEDSHATRIGHAGRGVGSPGRSE